MKPNGKITGGISVICRESQCFVFSMLSATPQRKQTWSGKQPTASKVLKQLNQSHTQV
jgi:hypothetical protein